ncbi:hypothetical protein [Geminocystis sp.]|uniref:hypothetical protein n=1 Tax=Geminocystis sp. TaxID=2664100 RepID=UPI00359369FC
MNSADYFYQCRQILTTAINELGFLVTDKKICEISELILESMTGKWRYFHSFEHILMVSKTGDSLITLAALFHDLVYLQIDNKISFHLTPYLNPFIIEKEGVLFIKSNLDYQDNCAEIVLRIFDLHLGNKLSSLNQNEFLSALIAAKILESFLPLSIITRIVTMIELTIPFRKIITGEKSIPHQLQQRLTEVNQKFNLGLNNAEIILTISQAVKFANIDVGGFASANVYDFINNTWLLLAETNHDLIDTHKYTIKDYRFSLAKTTLFLNSLSPQLIFHQYNNQPNIVEFQELVNITRYNLTISKYYLATNLVSISLLEALCYRFQCDISLSFLFDFSHKYLSIMNFLPSSKPYHPQNEIEKQVLILLDSEFDCSLYDSFKNTLFSSFIVRYLSFTEILNYQTKCYLFFDNQLDSEEFLRFFPLNLINIISEAIAKLLMEKQKAVIMTKNEK